MTNRAIESSAGDLPPASTLLLLIESGRNQELLAEQFGDEFTIQTEADDPFKTREFDLCLLDTQSIATYHDQLRDAKVNATPTFLPCLLFAGQRSLDQFSHHIWDIADEVIQRPVNRAELETRVYNLLQRRRLSVELTQEKERSEQRFEFLFRSTPDPVIVVTPEGIVTEINDAFAEVFRVDPDNLIGQPLTDLDVSPTEAVHGVLLQLTDEAPSTATIDWELDAGESLVTELSTKSITSVGNVSERIGVFRDITSRVKRKEELERQNARLEEFANTIAHDLRNPLNVAQGRLELAEDTGDREHYDAMRQSLGRMERMITELLTLAKQGQAILDPDSVRLITIIQQAWGSVETRHASFDLEIDHPIVILADEGRLRQLLENLFRNAIEHGSETVTVRVGLLPNADGFYIEDDGPGIPPEKRSTVFEAGFSDAEEGTGFGLSIVQQIVDGHGWTIEVTESVDGGARFEISDAQLS